MKKVLDGVILLRANMKDNNGHIFTEKALMKIEKKGGIFSLNNKPGTSALEDMLGTVVKFKKDKDVLKCGLVIDDSNEGIMNLVPAIEGKITKKHKIIGEDALYIDEVDLIAVSLGKSNADPEIPPLKAAREVE